MWPLDQEVASELFQLLADGADPAALAAHVRLATTTNQGDSFRPFLPRLTLIAATSYVPSPLFAPRLL